ncbi:hypothetical protein B0T26DRAFT_659725 [Lasiosphaeria miniovina]|uniref:Glutamine repeat protein-1 n=1 Tax=Lasiosphaeria miniovina TaxID=1954250 RepID=A0AA40DFS1_9PEZI|nr:uncharacterized protein B0T26DRAFT_659725 [Lasiosphaeria miniovina]KAK0701809.1 hypothetical protein B0T26DRAFT_659725 [Lasiosphaeria miniovina]
MYSAPYGYPNASGGPSFNGAPPPQNPHMQPGPSPNQTQQMMYNTQQFPMGGPQGPHFPGAPNPAMMGGAGLGGVMPSTAMHPMAAANGQMAYQTPYSGSPYGPAIPSSAPPQPQLPANYMMSNSIGQFQMNQMMPQQQQQQQHQQHQQQQQQRLQQNEQQQNQQHQQHQQQIMQRIQNQQNMSISTPQRPFNTGQGTPNSSMPPQQPGQISTPQGHSTPQSQTPTTAQPMSASGATPQTPTFPSTGQQVQLNGTSGAMTPQSPGTESRDKERFSVLLEINQELLYESVSLVNHRAELKKEQAAGEVGEVKNGEVDYVEEERLSTQDYAQCMRRLQANLTYLAALADRKPSVQVPPCPAYLMPPPLNLNIRLRVPQSTPDDSTEPSINPSVDRPDRDKLMKDLYRKLQALFPGIDPRKEPAAQMPNTRAPPGQHPSQMAMKAPNGQIPGPNGSPGPGAQAQRTPQMTNSAAPMLQS